MIIDNNDYTSILKAQIATKVNKAGDTMQGRLSSNSSAFEWVDVGSNSVTITEAIEQTIKFTLSNTQGFGEFRLIVSREDASDITIDEGTTSAFSVNDAFISFFITPGVDRYFEAEVTLKAQTPTSAVTLNLTLQQRADAFTGHSVTANRILTDKIYMRSGMTGTCYKPVMQTLDNNAIISDITIHGNIYIS